MSVGLRVGETADTVLATVEKLLGSEVIAQARQRAEDERQEAHRAAARQRDQLLKGRQVDCSAHLKTLDAAKRDEAAAARALEQARDRRVAREAELAGLSNHYDYRVGVVERELRELADPQICAFQARWRTEVYELMATPPQIGFMDRLERTKSSDPRWAAEEMRARAITTTRSQAARIEALHDAIAAAEALKLMPLSPADTLARLETIDAALPVVTFGPLFANAMSESRP